MYVYIYIYKIYVCVYIYICMYIYICIYLDTYRLEVCFLQRTF